MSWFVFRLGLVVLPTRQGSLRLFRFQGIDVFIHWSWIFVALYQINTRQAGYSTLVWSVLEYLTLFVIVLMHEFGHALACRQVGGQADQIVLWPLGGVAYVNAPQRPGAYLWSIAAGPLVNVALAPIFLGIWFVGSGMGWSESMPDLSKFIFHINFINLGLLVFNLLPIYPSDGGQILRGVLWYLIGPARSLVTASIVGLVGVVGLIALAVGEGSVWIGVIALFILMNCGRGLMRGLAMARLAKAPRRPGFACPACQAAPPMGKFWVCGKCSHIFDAFEALTICPKCGYQFNATRCLDCGALNPISHWIVPAASAGPVPPRI
ncbi:MAG TPA: M50 family metallopeptidase [Verrucomicrobiae bacterium]|nr:M50 family metallopeptidase [Verrucomicrobiae bacterium]